MNTVIYVLLLLLISNMVSGQKTSKIVLLPTKLFSYGVERITGYKP